jgi:hypothetical protein
MSEARGGTRDFAGGNCGKHAGPPFCLLVESHSYCGAREANVYRVALAQSPRRTFQYACVLLLIR